ncbi:uroporphyrinogen decarboxylase [Nitriliruptoraceae bacterium ZYF776]|nr:uroporphyrinogen decarboxylase [Profundirhabdus halotolerans]
MQPAVAPAEDRHADSPFLAACRGLPHDRVPVWFMRQAGRALPEYRAVRERHAFEEVVHTPDLATEVTLQPIRRYGVDAAILFSDIVTPLQGLGIGLTIQPGVGPVVEQPFRTPEDVGRLRDLEPSEDVPFVLETVRQLVAELPVPLIGFGGAPFTLASYLVEGGPSRNYTRTKALMFGDEPTWHRLLDQLASITLASLTAQVEQGARAVQLFDSWAGALHPEDYRRYVLPHSSRVLAGLAELGVPRIHFGVNTGELLGPMAAAGADVVGVDWRTPLADAWARVPTDVGLQGNLEPAVTLGPRDQLEARVRDVLAGSGDRARYVFNLGHGVLPATDPAALRHVVELVHEEGRVTVEPDGA